MVPGDRTGSLQKIDVEGEQGDQDHKQDFLHDARLISEISMIPRETI